MKQRVITVTPKQLIMAAQWVARGAEYDTDAELLVDDRMLVVTQGLDKAAFDTGGEPAGDEYIATAPLDR